MSVRVQTRAQSGKQYYVFVVDMRVSITVMTAYNVP